MKRLKSVSVVIALVLLASLPVLAQRGRGGRGAAPPPPQAMQDVANSIVELVNNQDADGLTGMTADGAVYLDEDGHALPATIWIGMITSGDSPKQLEISGMRGDVWNDTGWVSFNYELDEEYEGRPVTLTGTASVVLQQVDGNWMIRMFHGPWNKPSPHWSPDRNNEHRELVFRSRDHHVRSAPRARETPAGWTRVPAASL